MRLGLWLALAMVVALVNAKDSKADAARDSKKKVSSTEASSKIYFEGVSAKANGVDPTHVSPALAIVKDAVDRFQNGSWKFIPKTVQNKDRILFVAGLEGTGHHGMKDVLVPCFDSGLCVPAPFTADLFHRTGASSHGLFGSHDGDYYNQHLEIFHAHLKDLAMSASNGTSDGKTSGGGHLHVVALETAARSGMLSYPNFGDPAFKVLDHPDLFPLVLLADRVGLDVRIIVLRRPAKDLLASALRRGFGGKMEPRILLENAIALNGHLALLDPKFFICLNYLEMGSMAPATMNSVSTFLHSGINEEMAKTMWSRFQTRSSSSSAPHLPSSRADAPKSPSSEKKSGNETATAEKPKANDKKPSPAKSVSKSSIVLKKGKEALHKRKENGHRRLSSEPATKRVADYSKYEYSALRLAVEDQRLRQLCPVLP